MLEKVDFMMRDATLDAGDKGCSFFFCSWVRCSGENQMWSAKG